MPDTDKSRDEGLKDLDARLSALEVERSPKTGGGASYRAMGQGYRFLGEVVGGVFGGLGFGALFDHFAKTAPFGLIGGLLIGIGVSTFVAVRGAGAWAKTQSDAAGPLPSGPDDDDE